MNVEAGNVSNLAEAREFYAACKRDFDSARLEMNRASAAMDLAEDLMRRELANERKKSGIEIAAEQGYRFP